MATIERPTIPTAPASTGTGTGTGISARRQGEVTPPRKTFFARSWFAIVLLAVFLAAHVYGWKVAEIDPKLLVQKSPDIALRIGQVLNPDIIGHDKSEIEMTVGVLGATNPTDVKPSEVSDSLTPVIKGSNNEDRDNLDELTPYTVTLHVSANTVAPGQEVQVSGTGYRPNTDGLVLWRSTGTSASVQTVGSFKADAKGNFNTKATLPTDTDRVINSSGFANTLAVRQSWDHGGAYPSQALQLVSGTIVQTVFIALMGTTLAVLAAVPLSFLAARNIMSNNLVGTSVYFVARTLLNILRSIEVLILAVIFAATVGLGPFAGVLALALHSVASLGKLYSEAIESIDPGPIEAITATGAGRLQVIMYAVVPQFIPQFLSFTMYRWDNNVRMSTVLGFVGAGGIGFILQQYINLTQWNQAGTAIWAIALVVILMDFVSTKVRTAVI